jgi:murein DD-endopeptidase MepM/ murein hydrolase activator NlpD
VSVDQIVTTWARRRNLDPRAVLGVMYRESGGNPRAVGDKGTSFGLFQLHIGGALGKMSPRDALNARKNAELATRLMAKSAAGLRGEAAIRAIVTQFERPANTEAEIQAALHYYNHGAAAGRVSSSTPSAAAPIASPASGLSPTGASAIFKLIRAANRAAGVKGSNLEDTLSAQASAPTPVSANPDTPSTGGPSSPTMTRGGYPLGKHGKLIGFPNQGTHTLGNWESDNAVDISASVGTPVVAMFDGTIGSQFGSLGEGGRFAGLRLHLDGKGNNAYYAHLSRFAAGIRPGTRVRKGQVIGYSGSANGVAHLHLAVLHGDPRSYLG